MDTIFGLNISLLDISLKIVYNEMKNTPHPNAQRSKEHLKFASVEIYIPEDIIKSVKNDCMNNILVDEHQYMEDIEKFFVYKKNKVILKIDFEDLSDVSKTDVSKKDYKYGNNFLMLVEKNIPFDILNNFFKDYKDYINYRKVINGNIKDSYMKICKLIFFNSSLYSYDFADSHVNFFLKEKKNDK